MDTIGWGNKDHVSDWWLSTTDALNAAVDVGSEKLFGRKVCEGIIERKLCDIVSQPGYKVSLAGRGVCLSLEGMLCLHLFLATKLGLKPCREDLTVDYTLPAFLIIELFAGGANLLANILLFRYGADGYMGLGVLLAVMFIVKCI